MTKQYEANVDDMDPRLWPGVIASLIEAGALDAWVTPIVMKKGRPATMLSVLCEDEQAHAVRTTVFAETTTIGIREIDITRFVLDRDEQVVDVHGQQIRVKSAYDDAGVMVNRSVEWEDVASAAAALERPAKEILAAATVAAKQL